MTVNNSLHMVLAVSFCLLVTTSVTQAQYAGGIGEPNDPYQIATAADLILLGESPEDYDKHFILTADLDLDPNLPDSKVFDNAVIAPDINDVESSFQGTPFTGVFDGKGHTIFNLTLNLPDEDYVGLFGHIGTNGTIRNLGVEDLSVTGNRRVGGLAGRSFQGVVSDCYSTGTVYGDGYVGGLVGSLSEGTIDNCYSTAAVSGQSYDIGGLVGLNGGGIISDSYSAGAVYGSRLVGGLVGYNLDGSIMRCSSMATVIGELDSTGGLVGRSKGTVINCYATGTVEGNESVGGLVGDAECTVSNCYSLCQVTGDRKVGGLVGDNAFSGIDKCYAAGRVAGIARVGGLIGDSFHSNASDCFWEIEASTQNHSAGGAGVIGLMRADMQHVDTYRHAGWDFVDESENGLHQIWQMPEDAGYPVLSILSGYKPVELPGMGTEQDPHQISTVEQIGALVYEDPSAHYQLISDIDASGVNWTMPILPIFSGVFDGNDHTIHEMHISSGRYAGVVGIVSRNGILKNLRVSDVNCVGGRVIGGLVGENRGEIINCSSTGGVAGDTYVGTLVGINAGAITRCYTSGAAEGELSIGGLVGFNRAGTVSNCYSRAAATGDADVGGLIGLIGTGAVDTCYATGEVTGDFFLGGLVGRAPADAVTYSFWDIDTSELTESAGGTGNHTTDMQKASTYAEAGWDFVNEAENGAEEIWWIDDGQDYPRLWWELLAEEPSPSPSP